MSPVKIWPSHLDVCIQLHWWGPSSSLLPSCQNHTGIYTHASEVPETAYRKGAFTTRECCKYKGGPSSRNVFFYFHTSLQEAYALIEKIEAEQNALYSHQKCLESSKAKKSRLPPPPILLARTHCSVTLKPAPFFSDAKVRCPSSRHIDLSAVITVMATVVMVFSTRLVLTR